MDLATISTVVGTGIGITAIIITKFERQSARTDKLYEMFIDLLKYNKDK